MARLDDLRRHVGAVGVQRPETHAARALHERRPVGRVGEEERAPHRWSGDPASLETGPPEARHVRVGILALGKQFSHLGTGLVSRLLAHLALELDVHAHLAAAEIEHLHERELRVRAWAVVRDHETPVVREPYVRLDLVAPERERFRERFDGVLG